MSVAPPAGSLAGLEARLAAWVPRPAKPARRSPCHIAPTEEHVRWAVELRPKLLARAVELAGGDGVLAEELVQDLYLQWWERPPRGSTATELKHWFRTVLQNMFRRRWRAKTLNGGNHEEYLTLPGQRELQFEPLEDDY